MKYNNFRELKTLNIEEAKIILASVSYDKGCSCGSGASEAPAKLRELSGYLPSYDSNFHNLESIKIYDYCDINEQNCEGDIFKKVEETATEILSKDKFMLFFGGDHSISIPLEKAFYQKYHLENKHPVIIHIDAHMDILDEYMDSKYSHACPNRRAIDNGYQVSDINMIGIRSYEKEEVEYKKQHPELNIITADNFRNTSVKTIVESIKAKYDKNTVYYVSFDIDTIDPGFAPGTGTPESFGLTPLQIRDLFEEIFSNLDVRAMDMVEIAPKLDVNDITSWLGLKLIYEIIYQKFIKE